MIDAFTFLLSHLSVCLRTRADLQAENLMLRYQLDVLRRSVPKRVSLTKIDRLILVWLFRLWPASIGALRIVRPKTLVRWHRAGFRLYWRWKSRPLGGRPRVSAELRALIRQMSTQNPLWGAPRIHGELLKLGFEVSEATVSRYLPRRPRDPDQRWKTFVANHRHCVASIDFLLVPTVPDEEELDPGLLLWKMRNRLKTEALPRQRVTIAFDFQAGRKRQFWFVIDNGEASVCVTDPGFEVGLVVTADLSTFYQVWLGKMPLRHAVSKNLIRIEGMPEFERAFANWFLWSPMAKFVSAASARDKAV